LDFLGMDAERLRELLEQVAGSKLGIDDALAELRTLPFEDLGMARLDHHRLLRTGFPEVVYCAGKTPDQVAQIVERLADRSSQVLGTRADPAHYEAAHAQVPDLAYHALARCIWLDRKPERAKHDGVIILAAGTSDLPVVEEAALTLDLMGHEPQQLIDVGVAGLHRLLPHIRTIQEANVVIVVAGMEGALASVIGGLTDAPVIAVPTSVGYGASFGGVAALLAMLNSCATGVAVVNIDNGYGAGHMAALINARIMKSVD
jgi:NCAIR mutase (PurE)-related protein